MAKLPLEMAEKAGTENAISITKEQKGSGDESSEMERQGAAHPEARKPPARQGQRGAQEGQK